MTKARDLGDNAQNTKPKVVNAKADLIVGTGSDAADRLAVGSNGDTLVADSSATTGLRWQADWNTGKNKIINGDFQIWQRGTSFTTGGSGSQVFTADRWQQYNYGTNTASCTQQTFTPGAAPVAGYEGQFFARFNSTNTSTFITYRIEDVRTLAGQTATLSFWAKSNANQTLATVAVAQNFGSGGSSAVSALNNTTTAITTSWARYSFTFTMPSVSGKTIGSSSYVYIEIVGAINNALDLWGFQLEAGSVATPFTTATGTLAGELAACQRYYFNLVNGSDRHIGVGSYEASSAAMCGVQFPVTMRTAPTLSATSGTDFYRAISSGGGSDNFTSFTIVNASTTGACIYNNSEISGTAGQACRFISINASSFVSFVAEL